MQRHAVTSAPESAPIYQQVSLQEVSRTDVRQQKVSRDCSLRLCVSQPLSLCHLLSPPESQTLAFLQTQKNSYRISSQPCILCFDLTMFICVSRVGVPDGAGESERQSGGIVCPVTWI